MASNILDKGLVQVYTGNGKGKTTAAFGLAWRMLGRGGKVYICQFLKPEELQTSEAKMAALLPGILPDRLSLERADYNWNMADSHNQQQRNTASGKIHKQLDKVREILEQGLYDLVILDEILVCYSMKLVSLADLTELVQHKTATTELVLTGRGGDEQVFQIADLVTKMEEIKHPYNNGTMARPGIDF